MEWFAQARLELRAWALLTVIVCAAGCKHEDFEATDRVAQGLPFGAAPPTTTPGLGRNSGPRISGTPRATVAPGETYLFTPSASDADGDALKFSVYNRPDWLAFDDKSGALSGIPKVADVGHYANVTIQVTDGAVSMALSPFSVDVLPTDVESAFLTWVPPTEYEDDSPLFELAGYRIRYGVGSGSYTDLIEVDDPTTTVLGLDFLPPDTYYFVITAYNYAGTESDFSNEAVITLN